MKKLIIIFIAILMNINYSFGQLNLSYVYPTDGPSGFFKLSLSGLKYIGEHSYPSGYMAYFKLYNPDHSLFKTITPPAFPGKDIANINYVSETLFNNDSLIEYLVTYVSSAGMCAIRICNENGSIILERDSAAAGGQILTYAGTGIFPDGNNYKLMVSKFTYSGSGAFSTAVEIYDLPGQFPCFECNAGVISNIGQPSNMSDEGNKSIAFPNPFNDFITIKYSLPKNTKRAFINLFGIAGNFIKKKEIDNHFGEIIITKDEIRQGAYIYQIIADGKIISNDKIIKL